MKAIKTFFLIFNVIIILSCDLPEDKVWVQGSPLTINEYNPDYHNMILVPVPTGGVTFPVGVDDFDDSTSTIYHEYYLGETTITVGLWYVVADWATNKKEGEKYRNIFFNKHKYFPITEMDFPINDINYIQAIIWCNAYTEWHNFVYGTYYTPVYIDETGKPIRNAINPMNPDYFKNGSGSFSYPNSRIRQLYNLLNDYLDLNKTMVDYLNNIETSGNGFRLPTPYEWELAARWKGYDNTGVLQFKSGDSLSNEVIIVSGVSSSMLPSVFLTKPKTFGNYLGIYEMSGNLREYVYHIEYILLMSAYDHPFAQTRGGSFLDNEHSLTISNKIYVDATSYNYYYGFRVARNID